MTITEQRDEVLARWREHNWGTSAAGRLPSPSRAAKASRPLCFAYLTMLFVRTPLAASNV
jgi:hypothetical protein